MASVKKLLLGNPLHNRDAAHQRVTKTVGLAVLSSDALSSVAYGPGEVLITLALAGPAALALGWPITIAIGILLVIVVLSYQQTIHEYPSGGGSYIVAKENLGTTPGLIAGASLLVDYILTVAVSISASIAAIDSALPALQPYKVPLCIIAVTILAVANLRGVKESGALFSGPTYAFIALLGLTVAAGLWRFANGTPLVIPVPEHGIEATQTLSLFLVLKAFSSGCAAMTGVEAIANGVTLFKEPSSKNARITMAWMGGILLTLLLGVSWLAHATHLQPSETETVISQLSRALFGTGPLYYIISAAVALILVLAANTAYADFPRLASLVAADDYLPHNLRNLGYRLVFSNGIILLTVAAGALLVLFGGVTTRLIPLYAIGVFTSFTLSQSGMVVHHFHKREPRWQVGAAINATGALATLVVVTVISVTKFSSGAWIVLLLTPAIIAYFLWVKRQYARVERELEMTSEEMSHLNWRAYNRMHNHVILLVKSIDRRLIRAIQYAKNIRADSVEALYIDIADNADAFRREWEEADIGIRLTVVESPWREVVSPVLDYVRAIERPTEDHVVTVILPEYVPENAADTVLHDQTSFWIKTTLFNEPGVIVTDVPYQIAEGRS